MTSSSIESTDVVVIGAGPAGTLAAIRAAELGARTVLVTRGAFGGMAANDGPVPVRTLAYAARLFTGTRQLESYGISTGRPALDYRRLLDRVREVVDDVRDHSAFRGHIDRTGVVLHENAGTARFVDPHTIQTESGRRIRAEKVILCAGGMSRRLAVPGSDLTATVADAWSLTGIPESMLVVGAGMTGVQVASIFHSFGSRVELFQAGRRILKTEDEDVSAAVATAFRKSGMAVHEDFGAIESFERTPAGMRMTYSKGNARSTAEAALAVVTVGWVADTAGLNLAAAGVATDDRGFVVVDGSLRTSASHVYAAGDITGRWMLVPQAVHDGYLAATHAVRGDSGATPDSVSPIGGFTDPEYARVGLTELQARTSHDAVVAVVRFDETTRTIIDGHKDGFCKLIANRRTGAILGCHVVGERAVEIVQVVAIAIASGFGVEQLARVPLSFPTYTGILARAAYVCARQIGAGVNVSHHPEAAFGS